MTEVKHYRARPVRIQAIQLTELNLPEVEAFAGGKARTAKLPASGRGLTDGVIITNTDDRVSAPWGHYLVRNSHGRLSTLSPGALAAQFEGIPPRTEGPRP